MSSSGSADKAHEVVALAIPLIVITTVAVVLRFWSRLLIHTLGSSRSRVLWWDDWLIMICFPFGLATTALDLSWTTFGLGKTMDQVSEPDRAKGLRVLWAIFWLYTIAIWLSKLSALAFYARVFSPGTRRFRLALWIVAGLCCAWIVAILVSLILQCSPPRKAWDRAVPGTCQDPYNWWLAGGVTSFVLDLIILLLPLPTLCRLQVKPLRRWLIIGVFLSGYSVVFVSLGRVIQQIREKPEQGPFLQDFTYDIIPDGKWISVESPIAIFCLCLPSIYALVKRGIAEGPRALFSLSRRRPESLQSHDRVTILHQPSSTSSSDRIAFDNANLYNLPLRGGPAGITAGINAAASNVSASGRFSAEDGGEGKMAGAKEVTLSGGNVIHVRTEISVETRSTWGDLIGVHI